MRNGCRLLFMADPHKKHNRDLTRRGKLWIGFVPKILAPHFLQSFAPRRVASFAASLETHLGFFPPLLVK